MYCGIEQLFRRRQHRGREPGEDPRLHRVPQQVGTKRTGDVTSTAGRQRRSGRSTGVVFEERAPEAQPQVPSASSGACSRVIAGSRPEASRAGTAQPDTFAAGPAERSAAAVRASPRPAGPGRRPRQRHWHRLSPCSRLHTLRARHPLHRRSTRATAQSMTACPPTAGPATPRRAGSPSGRPLDGQRLPYLKGDADRGSCDPSRGPRPSCREFPLPGLSATLAMFFRQACSSAERRGLPAGTCQCRLPTRS